MTRVRRCIVGAAVAAVLLLGAGALLLHLLLPDDAQFATELSERFERASGIGLRVGAAHWALRPAPVVVLEDLATAQPSPIQVRRIVLHPRLDALWTHRLAIASLEVEGAVLPSTSVHAFRGRWAVQDDPAHALPGAWALAAIPVERVELRELTWIDRQGIALAYDANGVFDAGWRPREAVVWRPEIAPPARIRIVREPGQDRWRVTTEVGGGSWNGEAELGAGAAGRLRLTAALAPQDVDVASLLRSFGRHAPLEGRLAGQTSLDAEGSDFAELLRSLHTRTRFTVAPATLTGVDLARAVRSAGISRGGQTPLDSLTGTVDTRFTDRGVELRYSGLKARSGVLTASGSATVLDRRLQGEAAVDIVDGVVGMPLKLGGTLDAPELSLTGGALTGAAVGTAVLPGVGTALGARIGQQVEQMFGSGSHPQKAPETDPAAAR
jgi:uncharacterized protein involved in outer membrane biogenesis